MHSQYTFVFETQRIDQVVKKYDVTEEHLCSERTGSNVKDEVHPYILNNLTSPQACPHMTGCRGPLKEITTGCALRVA